MWNSLFHINTLRRKIRKKGIVLIALLNICYLSSFLIVDCTVMGGRSSVNFTGYLICVLSEQHFLTFAVLLSVVFGVHEMHEVRLPEALAYKSRNVWTKNMLLGSITYSLLYVLFLLCMMLLLAFASGIDFSDLRTPCEGMDWLIPHILYGSEEVDILKLAIVNVGNVSFYCITIAVFYGFIRSISGHRVIAILGEVAGGIIILVTVKSVMRWSYPLTPLGNVILSMSNDRWNDHVNWPYWLIVNAVIVSGTFYVNRKQEFCHDL